jgi:hypothetical protein
VHRMTDEPVTPPELEQGLREILADLKGEPRPEPLRLVAGEPIPAAMPPDVLADLFEECGPVLLVRPGRRAEILDAEAANLYLQELERVHGELEIGPVVDATEIPAIEVRGESISAAAAITMLGDDLRLDPDPLPSLMQPRRDPFPGKRVVGVRVRKGKTK